MRIAISAALLASLVVISASSGAIGADTGAKICAAAPKNFPVRETMPVEMLKQRLSEVGVPPTGENWKDVDTSCDMMTMIKGFAAMPTVHLGKNGARDVAMTLQISGRNGRCFALIFSLDGC
jgi:hypothetical protein